MGSFLPNHFFDFNVCEDFNLKKEVVMDLLKWKDLKPKFPSVVEKFFGSRKDGHFGKITSPSVNISNKDKAFEVSVAVPGFDRKEINLEVQNNCLIISSERKYENEENNAHWMRKEFGFASFQRMFQLPENADPNQVDASMKNGILKIKVGKRKGYEPKVREIEVK